jgi:hypothetical protein
MVGYTCGFYRIITPFDEAVTRRTLKSLEDLGQGFFPATLWTATDKKVVLENAGRYDRSLIPAGYYVSPGIATLPLDAANGVSFVFTETDDPRILPGSLVLNFTDADLAANGWHLEGLVRLFKAVVASFGPDYAYLYDNVHGVRPSYTERMFDFDGRRLPNGLFWINYYGPEWARNIGRERLERLRRPVACSSGWTTAACWSRSSKPLTTKATANVACEREAEPVSRGYRRSQAKGVTSNGFPMGALQSSLPRRALDHRDRLHRPDESRRHGPHQGWQVPGTHRVDSPHRRPLLLPGIQRGSSPTMPSRPRSQTVASARHTCP